ncbi:unnamed protein product [Phytomonas sp. EM1]|nr:unnamed protein product [Phytomonas sp. EM1]|eukprot:CCW60694.1 unnamed protein product [Phytomonas sp. isolate EM1]
MTLNNRTSTITHYASIVSMTKRLLLNGPASVNGIRKLSRAFGISNDCGGFRITRDAFRASLKEVEILLAEDQLKVIFTILDQSGSDTLDPSEFVAALRYNISPLRRVWVRRVLNTFSLNPDGTIPLSELHANFRAEGHPVMVSGARTASEVAEDFQSSFNLATNPEGVISVQEFEEYYAGISGTFCDDVDFVAMLRGVWPIKGVCNGFSQTLALEADPTQRSFSAYQTIEQKNQVVERMKVTSKMMSIIVDEHRRKVTSDGGLSLRLLGLALRSADTSDSLFLSVQDFLGALRSRRLYIECPEAICMLDTNRDGSVDYVYYLELLVPELPATRRLLLERLWQKLFPEKDSRGRVRIKEFQAKFVARNADEKNGFLSAWDVRKAVRGKVGLSELIEWYVPTSLGIQLEKDFETLLREHWPEFTDSN